MSKKRSDVEKELHWKKTIREAACSGLSIAEFCRQRHLKENQFYWWRRRVTQSSEHAMLKQSPNPKQASFGLVTNLPGELDAGIEPVPGDGRRLRISKGVDEETSRFLSHYGLTEQPFGVTPDPKYLYWTPSHREAFVSLHSGITSDRGFITLIAPPGHGKTTLLFHLLDNLKNSARTAFLFQTQGNSTDFLRQVVADLGIDSGELDLVALQSKLNEIAISCAQEGKRLVLIIDEAQNLADPVLETVRLLTNFETPARKLIQIVLAGQTQLAVRLSSMELAQLRQRIAVMGGLEPLNATDIYNYIEHRLNVAGLHGPGPFRPEALALIAAQSQGIPRLINNICFDCLSLGFVRDTRRIDAGIAREAIRKNIDAGIIREAIRNMDLAPLPAKESRSPVLTISTAEPDSLRQTFAYYKVRNFRRRAIGIAASVIIIFLSALIVMTTKRAPPNIPEPSVPKLSTTIPIPIPAEYTDVTIRPNDSLSTICIQYLRKPLNDRLQAQIMKLNPQISNPAFLMVGKTLRLPIAQPPKHEGRVKGATNTGPPTPIENQPTKRP